MNQSTFKEEHFNFRHVSVNEKPEEIPGNLLEWVNNNPIIDPGAHSIYCESGKNLQELAFSLKGKASSHYPLLKGLISSGRPAHLTLQADDSSRNLSLKFDMVHEKATYLYISRILGIIQEEIRFKQVLRKVIENQEQFNLEERLLLNELGK